MVSKIPELITAIVEEFKENGPEIIQIGKDVVMGIWNGIKSLVGWLNEKIGNFVGGIVDNVKGVLGIHSPSRVHRGSEGRYRSSGQTRPFPLSGVFG